MALRCWQVSEGLFTQYQLPNGRTAFLYYNAGSAMDEAEFAPVAPPVRPTTVPLALQQSMPLANVMSLIAKPPGTAPPHKPYKPVPRLVPLPGSHTLTVMQPESRSAESYGQLRPDNMQLLLKAEVRHIQQCPFCRIMAQEFRYSLHLHGPHWP